MRKLPLVVAVLCLGAFLSPQARAQDRIEFFGGFSYLRPPVTLDLNETSPCPGCPPTVVATDTHPNLTGWEFSGTLHQYKWLSGTADIGGDYGSDNGGIVHLETYLFGLQIRRPGKFSPFAHILFGAAHESVMLNSSPGFTNPGKSTAFAAGAGGGLDIRVASVISFRVIQFDYIATRFGQMTQSQPRASAGIVIHF
jgi:hypothetical protein